MSQNIDPIVVEPMIINEIEIDLEEQPVRLRKLKRMIEPDEDNEQPEEIKIEKKNNFGAKLKKMAENKNGTIYKLINFLIMTHHKFLFGVYSIIYL